MTANIAAIFDMDKTLLRVDSAWSWSTFLYRRGELKRRTLAKAVYWTALYKAALLDLDAVFAKLVADLEGETEAAMQSKVAEWFTQDVAPMIAAAGRDAIAYHRAQGHLLVLATGSTQYAAAPVAAALGIPHVLSSRLQVHDGVFTGRAEAVCFGAHKVRMVEAFAARARVDLAQSFFYSDSYHDLPMLARVGNPIAINADVRLARHAKANGWPRATW